MFHLDHSLIIIEVTIHFDGTHIKLDFHLGARIPLNRYCDVRYHLVQAGQIGQLRQIQNLIRFRDYLWIRVVINQFYSSLL